jgi:hypothetical protein
MRLRMPRFQELCWLHHLAQEALQPRAIQQKLQLKLLAAAGMALETIRLATEQAAAAEHTQKQTQ